MPAGCRRCGGGGGTLPRPSRHDKKAVGAPVRARGHGADRRTRHLCDVERATALKARVVSVLLRIEFCSGGQRQALTVKNSTLLV